MGLNRGRVVRTIGPEGGKHAGAEYRNVNITEFDDRVYVFSHRAILTLVVVSSCNAACKFCSNEITFTPSGPFLQWGPQLERVKDFALIAGVRKIAYTGGEPTLNPQGLHDLMAAMNPGFARARLHTNGYGLFRDVATTRGQDQLIDALIRVGLTGASVSVAHFDAALNRKIMVLTKSWPGMSDDDLRAVASRGSGAFTPRLSCVMTNEGVHSVDQIFSYMEWGRDLGYRKFIFRTCSEIPDGFKKPTAFSEYNDANHFGLESTVAEVAARPGVELVYRQRKSDSKVDVFRWRDVTFDIDESSEEPDPDPKIRRLNVMPDGVTYISWIDPLATLFADERELAGQSMAREFPGTTGIALSVGPRSS